MNRIMKNGYKINDSLYLGQRVIYNNEERVIIGFGVSRKHTVVLNVSPERDSDALINSLFVTHILKGYENETNWKWCDISDLEIIKDKKERCVTLKFDTKELQEKLEKAVYHLKEFNSILDDLNSNGVNLNIKRGDDK